MSGDLEKKAADALQAFIGETQDMSSTILHRALQRPVSDAVIFLIKTVKQQNTAPQRAEGWEEREEKASRMADLIVDVMKEKGDCQKDDLLQAGFSEADITKLWPLAQGFVAVRTPVKQTLS